VNMTTPLARKWIVLTELPFGDYGKNASRTPR
jgi:hypothetical protein